MASKDYFEEEGLKCYLIYDAVTEKRRHLSDKLFEKNIEYEQTGTKSKAKMKKKADCQPEIVNMGCCSVFRTIRYKNGQSMASPVYYINNVSEELMHRE